MNLLKPVDHAAIRTNQSVIILLLIVSFVVNFAWVTALVAFFMLLGTLVLHRPGFLWVYTRIARPLGIAHPDIVQDHPEPHQFAQGFGGVVLVVAVALLLTGVSVAGWALVWLVVALAALNLFGGFCVGCAVYYWLNRLNLPGFVQSPPEGTFPGLRPRR